MPKPAHYLLFSSLVLPAVLAAQAPPQTEYKTTGQRGREIQDEVKQNEQEAYQNYRDGLAGKEAPANVRSNSTASGDEGIRDSMAKADRADEQQRLLDEYAEAVEAGDMAAADAIMENMIAQHVDINSTSLGNAPWIKKDGRTLIAYSGGKARDVRPAGNASPNIKNAAGNRKIRTKEVDLSVENTPCYYGAKEQREQMVAGLQGGRKGFELQYSTLKAALEKNPNDAAAAARMNTVQQAIANQDAAIKDAQSVSRRDQVAELGASVRSAKSHIARLEEAVASDPSAIDERRKLASYKACLARDGAEYERLTQADQAKATRRETLAEQYKALEDATNAFNRVPTEAYKQRMVEAQKKLDDAKIDYEYVLFESFPEDYEEYMSRDRELRPGPGDMTGEIKGMQKDETKTLPRRGAPQDDAGDARARELWAEVEKQRSLEREARNNIATESNASAARKAELEKEADFRSKMTRQAEKAYDFHQSRRAPGTKAKP